MTALLDPLERLTSNSVQQIFKEEPTCRSNEVDTGRNLARMARRLVEANQLVQRRHPKPQEQILRPQHFHISRLEELSQGLMQQVANALDWRSRESLALVCHAIREAIVLPHKTPSKTFPL